jgi:hypothetical protein
LNGSYGAHPLAEDRADDPADDDDVADDEGRAVEQEPTVSRRACDRPRRAQ